MLACTATVSRRRLLFVARSDGDAADSVTAEYPGLSGINSRVNGVTSAARSRSTGRDGERRWPRPAAPVRGWTVVDLLRPVLNGRDRVGNLAPRTEGAGPETVSAVQPVFSATDRITAHQLVLIFMVKYQW